MKKPWILSIFILILPGLVFAQNFSGGIIAGMSATQVEGDGYGG